MYKFLKRPEEGTGFPISAEVTGVMSCPCWNYQLN